MWRFTSTHLIRLTNLDSLKGRVANDALIPSLGHTRFREGAGPQNRGLGAQIAANMTEVQLTVEGAEHDVVDVLLEDLTSLRRTFYDSVENVTARAQSARGSRKVGQDSDDELSAGDREQDDED
jgi:hypothetical protein